jgi:hypothetical protein
MPKFPGRPNPPRPSAMWYFAGLLPLILGIVASVVISRMSDIAPEPVKAFHTGERAEVVLAEEGLTILFGRGWGSGVSVRCAVLDADGEPITLTYGVTWEEVSYQGSEWNPAYETSDPQPPGRYTVECDSAGNDVEVAVAPISPPGQGALFDTLLYVALLTGFAVSVLTTVIIIVLRRRSRRRGPTAHTALTSRGI